jgi:hypothetical protein
MPFGESQSKIYVSIVDGQLAVRCTESDPKAVKRELSNGTTIFERRYRNYTGRIKEIGFRNQEHNTKKWEELFIIINDGQDLVQLQMPFPGKYSNSLLRAIKNADLAKEMTFSPWTKTVNDKVKACLYINQAGKKESVAWFYTQENPNGLPDLVPYTVPGSSETKYSDVERNKFLRNMVETEIAPALQKIWSTAQAIDPVIHPDPVEIIDPVDDLPF